MSRLRDRKHTKLDVLVRCLEAKPIPNSRIMMKMLARVRMDPLDHDAPVGWQNVGTYEVISNEFPGT
jgi:hypothetical protein